VGSSLGGEPEVVVLISGDEKEAIRRKVQVWIFCTRESGAGRVFLVLKTLPERGGFWQPVTGGVESGESLEGAARREVQEETGLTRVHRLIQLDEPFSFESRWGGSVTEYGFAIEVLSSSMKEPEILLDGREHESAIWVSSAEALNKVHFQSNAKMLQGLLKKLENEEIDR
jgi:8-oxo-dGTP pyrophosphatase MutT (NUDIX family)